MSDFIPFARAVHAQYNKIKSHELFTTAGDPVAAYLAAFPEGTNPIYLTNTEHDCSCCKNFIKNLGSVVAIIDNKITTVWDVQGLAYPYDVVAKVMDSYVKAQAITGLFRTTELSYGAEKTLQTLPDSSVKRWNHFYGSVADKHRTPTPDKVRGEAATNVQTLKRGLEELTPEALAQVLELIDANSLYRGEEHKATTAAFQKLQNQYLQNKTPLFLWLNHANSAAFFRNTVIGTLVQDLSEKDDLEGSVRSFEAKVAPANYKRPTTLVTPRMVEEAMKTIKELDYEDSLSRRMARISDVGVTNVLWVDNETQAKMKGGIESLLMAAAKSNVKPSKQAENISIDDFMALLPKVTGMEVLVKNTHGANFMSLTAPVHDNTKPLFKWPNNFGWSYDGNMADSIKEKVKKAGGNVTNAVLRVSLAWFNYDDLDIHIYEPNGNHIYYCNKSNKQDVDMNAGGGHTREPVENVSWTSVPDGAYLVKVNNFSCRETTNVGFVIEIENEGKLTQLAYKAALRGTVEVCTLHLESGVIVKVDIADGVEGGGISQEKWGINTEQFVKVNTLMNSPNHWDGNAVGNKHWFFILQGCKNDQPTRGIYNEFLTPELDKHRKVFELLGDKTKCPVTDEQLSGLGFSSTSGAEVTVKVTGPKLNKTLNVKF